jgi:hypothetical protein
MSEDGRRRAFPPPRGEDTGYREPQVRDEQPVYPDELPPRRPHLQPFSQDDPLSPEAVASHLARARELKSERRRRAPLPLAQRLVALAVMLGNAFAISEVFELLGRYAIAAVLVLLLVEAAVVVVWVRRRARDRQLPPAPR